MNLADKVQNKHTGKEYSIVDIEEPTTGTDTQTVYVLSNGTRWRWMALYEHFEVVKDESN